MNEREFEFPSLYDLQDAERALDDFGLDEQDREIDWRNKRLRVFVPLHIDEGRVYDVMEKNWGRAI